MTLIFSKHNFFSSLVFRWLIVRNIIQDVLISDSKHLLPWSHGPMETYLGAVEAHPGAVEALPGSMEAHRGAMEAHPGAVESHPGALGAHPKPWRL